jgi:hypothetical protein
MFTILINTTLVNTGCSRVNQYEGETDWAVEENLKQNKQNN